MIKNNLTIVMYHYVRDLKKSKYPKIKGLELNLFKEKINFFLKKYSIITMEEVIYSIENNTELPINSMLLTFDDAYLDHYSNVFPVLSKHKIQGSFYVPIKAVSENVVLDVNKIHYVLASVDRYDGIIKDLKELVKKYKEEYNLFDFDYYYNRLAVKNAYDTAEVRFIKLLLQNSLEEKLRVQMVNFLFEKYVHIDEKSLSKELYMDEYQLKHMVESGMHVGNHGLDHYWWNELSKVKMKEEICLPNKFLERIGVDMKNWTACYPYGAYNDQSVDILKKNGCKLALTTKNEIANTNYKERFRMPRMDTNEFRMY